MKNKQNKNKTTKKTLNLADFIGWLLFVQGFIFTLNAVTTDDDWFSRTSMSFVCFGFAGIIFRLRK